MLPETAESLLATSAVELKVEPRMGLSVPVPFDQADRAEIIQVLQDIASFCVVNLGIHLEMENDDLQNHLVAYLQEIYSTTDFSNTPDFLMHIAKVLESIKESSAEIEYQRLQKLLQRNVFDRVSRWVFGPVPGRFAHLHHSLPVIKSISQLLSCPVVASEDLSVIHVVSANPVSVRLAAFWIHEETERAQIQEFPFVFPLTVDYSIWQQMCLSQFSATPTV